MKKRIRVTITRYDSIPAIPNWAQAIHTTFAGDFLGVLYRLGWLNINLKFTLPTQSLLIQL
jgi:hypothetical protein